MAENAELRESRPDNTIPFRAALSNIFGEIGEAVSEQKFAECQSYLRSQFSGKKFDSIITKLHATIAKDLQERMNEEVKGLLTEESLIEGLEKIKMLMRESQCNADHVAWRPPGDVKLHQRTLDIVKIDAATAELSALLSNLENENDQYIQEIARKRQKVFALDKKVTKSTKIAIDSISKLESTRDRIQNYVDGLDNEKNINEHEILN